MNEPPAGPAGLPVEAIAQFLAESEDLFSLVDRAGRIRWLNPAAAAFLESEAGDCLGRSCLDTVHPEDRRGVEDALARAGRPGAPPSDSLEVRLRGPSGRELHALWTVHAVRASGDLAGFTCCARDITSLRRSQEELEASEQRLRTVLSSVLDPIITIDGFGTIQSASASCERVLGWSPDELVGSNIKILMPDPHRGRHDGYLERYRETGRTEIIGKTRDFEVLRRDGSPITCELSISRATLPDGRELFTGIFRDVSGYRAMVGALRDSELRFHALFDQAYQFLGMLDREGRLLEVNQTALDAAGLAREEVVGRPLWETRWWDHSEALARRVREAVQAAAEGEFVRFEARHPARGGGWIEVDFSLKPVHDEGGNVVMLIPEGRDITEIKRAQRAETGMLRALATIGESAALLAHEIKNPITAVNLALRAVADELGEDHQAVLRDLVGRMQHLEQTMRRTLSFARPIDLHPEPLDLRRLAQQAVETFVPQASERGIDLRVSAPRGEVPLSADPVLVRELLVNLITNALEVTPRGGRVLVDVARSPGRELVVSVDDDGPGIAEEILPNLFKPFATARRSGSGLGLAICKKIAEAHGATITGGRSEAGGARFEVRFPPQPEPADGPRASSTLEVKKA